MRLHKNIVRIPTGGRRLTDITNQVQTVIDESQFREGLANIFIRHTSASLLVQENADVNVQLDLERFLGDLVPDGDQRYQHTAEGPDDMSAHVRSMLTPTTLTIPFESGKLGLGQWQAIYLWEHRYAREARDVHISVLGEA